MPRRETHAPDPAISARVKAYWTPERRKAMSDKMKAQGGRLRKSDGAAPVRRQTPIDPAPTPAAPESPKAAPAPMNPPGETLAVGSMSPPPATSDQMMAPPSTSTEKPAAEKVKWWDPKPPTSEELKEIESALIRLVGKGFAGLAQVREYSGWVHSDDELRPYGVVIRILVKRFLKTLDFDMILLALALMEIAEIEGTKAMGDLKAHRRPKAPTPDAPTGGDDVYPPLPGT